MGTRGTFARVRQETIRAEMEELRLAEVRGDHAAGASLFASLAMRRREMVAEIEAGLRLLRTQAGRP